MAKMTYTISCSCGARQSGTNSSGDPDRYMNDFVCPHFRCSIYESSQWGYFFGSNAHATVTVNWRCSEGDHSNTWCHKWWGWCLAGDPISNS